MAAALLDASLAGDASVSSAGIGAMVGSPADIVAVELMEERGLDITAHVARQLDENLLRDSDVVVTMDSEQVKWIEKHWPQSCGRVYRWGHWGDFDVPDPYRRGDRAFRDALELILDGLDDWSTRLRQIT